LIPEKYERHHGLRMFPNKTCGKDHQMVSESLFEKMKENKNKMTPASVQLAPFSADSKPLRARFPAAAHSKSQRIGNCGLESTCLAIKSLGESSESDMNYITVYYITLNILYYIILIS